MSKTSPPTAPVQTAEMTSPEMVAYYNNRPLMWRNLWLIMLLSLGWGTVFTVVSPLIQLRMNNMGFGEGALGTLGAINCWAYSYLVMYFAWKSDHTVSRFGRRVPYLFLSAPVIVIGLVVFPFLHSMWLITAVWLLQAFFMDIKAATIPLLNIDCMPRRMLARAGLPTTLAMGVLSFFALRYGMTLAQWNEYAPYLIGGGVLLMTTLFGGFLIREPPVHNPTTETFKPWSAMKVAWQDPRRIVLMISVSLFQAYLMTYGCWVWLFAKNTLGMDRADTGQALAWGVLASLLVAAPVAWLVDRVSPYKLMPAFCAFLGVHLLLVFQIHNQSSLMLVACLAAVLAPLYSASDIMVYRTADPKTIGSLTSTNSCLRGLFNGGLSLGMGQLIQHTGHNYYFAFVAGYALQLLGLVALFSYRHLMSSKPVACLVPAEIPVPILSEP